LRGVGGGDYGIGGDDRAWGKAISGDGSH